MGVAASANFPLLLLSLFRLRFNTTGAIAGLTTGLPASIGLILARPTVTGIDSPDTNDSLIHAGPWYRLENPGILSVPISFTATVLGTLRSGQSASEAKFHELQAAPILDLGAKKEVLD